MKLNMAVDLLLLHQLPPIFKHNFSCPFFQKKRNLSKGQQKLEVQVYLNF